MLKTSTKKSISGKPALLQATRLQFLIIFFSLTIMAGNIFAQSAILKSGKLSIGSKQKQIDLIHSGEPHLQENRNDIFPQSVLIAIYDSVYTWSWDTISLGWKFQDKTINIIYDSNNNVTSYTTLRWDSNNTWVNSNLYTMIFDGNNNKLSDLSQRWNGSAWENFSLWTSTYDSYNNLTTDLSQDWIGGIWENSSLRMYTYDGNNNRISSLYQNWDVNMWVNTSQYTYTYDSYNNQTSSLTQNWNGSIWEDRYRYTYTYDASNNNLSRLSQSWNGSTWINTYIFTYTYDANNNRINSLSQNWNLNSWENSFQSTFTYDSNNNRIYMLFQSWNNNAWETTTTFIYTYDSNNFSQSEVRISSSSIDSTYLYFHVITGVNEILTENAEIIAYPNPFDNQLKINSTDNKIEEVVLVDMIGMEVLRSKIFIGETKISTEKLLSGFYLLKFTDGNKKSNIKLIKY